MSVFAKTGPPQIFIIFSCFFHDFSCFFMLFHAFVNALFMVSQSLHSKRSPGIIQNWSPGSFKTAPWDHPKHHPGIIQNCPLGSSKTPPRNHSKLHPRVIQNDPRDHSRRPSEIACDELVACGQWMTCDE